MAIPGAAPLATRSRACEWPDFRRGSRRDDSRAERLVYRVETLTLREIGKEDRQLIARKGRPEQRSDCKEPVRLPGEPVEPKTDDLLDPFGDADAFETRETRRRDLGG